MNLAQKTILVLILTIGVTLWRPGLPPHGSESPAAATREIAPSEISHRMEFARAESAGGWTAVNAPAEEPVVEGSWARELRLARELATQNPPAALAWVEQLAVKEERDEALREICLQIARHDPAAAMNAAWRFELGKAEGRAEAVALEDLARQWAATDLAAARDWIGKQPAGSRRDRVMKGVASILARTAPADAAQLVAQQIPPGPLQCEAAMAVLNQWATSDLNGATAWAEQFPAGWRELAKANLAQFSQSQSGVR